MIKGSKGIIDAYLLTLLSYNMLNSLTIRQIYAHQEMEVSIKDRKIYYRPSENKSAVTLLAGIKYKKC